MFNQTSNHYRFKFLVTGLTGPGIEQVYLPPQPPAKDILFKKENKFVRSVPPDYLKTWMDQAMDEKEKNQDYIHPHQEDINQWEDQQFERNNNGMWFWNKGVATFINGPYHKYLNHWELYFGFPDYRETDKEVFYWIQYWEEDPFSYGGTYNTCRREGKSSKMGFWIMNRASTSFSHFGGMQGTDNLQIQDFYNEMVMTPFYKMERFLQPTYDTTSLQKKGIIFKEPPQRNKKRTRKLLVLESKIDYRTSEPSRYDQAALHSYVMEEAGKLLSSSVAERWKFVKPCLKRGIYIRGKSFLGTTCEYMDVSSRGGRAYQKLCMESDFDIRQPNGQTISGLYASMMPADCVLEGFIDTHGFPEREKARKWILDEREAVKGNAKDYSDLIRKYPLNWKEVFYISADKCEFNATILQDRRSELQLNPPQLRRLDLRWENNVRFTKIVMFDNPDRGWFKTGWIPKEESEVAWLNNVGIRHDGQNKKYFPKNDGIFQCGTDPIDHGVRVESAMVGDEMLSSRRSRPVLFVKRKYDSAIDGPINQEILEERARIKFNYKTNKYIAMMDQRPNDPNVYFERALMICWLLGVSIHCESQKPGLMNFFNNSDCSDFVQNKYVPLRENMRKSDAMADGTPASPMMIQEYTGAIATDVEYFGHTYLFIEMCDDDLVFDPNKTREHDYTVAQGWTELAGRARSKIVAAPTRAITDYFHRFRVDGSLIK